MLKAFTLATVFGGSVAASLTLLPTRAAAETLPELISKDESVNEVVIQEVAPEKPKETRLVCKSCNVNETIVLDRLQDHGLKDPKAIATIMGNIRQESTFIPEICEGGARTGYHRCRRGGFGLIQWTSVNRFLGLGKYARKINGDPSSIHTQLSYLLEEGDWKMIETHMFEPGKTINDYMRLARKWIRWGHHGSRTAYAYDYLKRFATAETEA